MGTQLRFATKTVRARLRGTPRKASSRPLFGNQLRFAVTTIREGVERRRHHPNAKTAFFRH